MTTTFYDRRAERELASALAEQHRAEAAGRLAEVELRRIDVEGARVDLAERQAEARQNRRTARRQRARTERAALRAALARVRSQVAGFVPAVVGAIAMAAPVLIGWDGQLRTAQAVLHLGPLAWVFPVALEGGAWWLAYLTHRAIADRLPTGRLRLVTWLLATVAAGMNVWSGAGRFGPVGGVGLGLASLLGIGLWEITAWSRRQSVAGRTATTARQAWIRRLRFPRLALAAASRAAALGEHGTEAAWRAAWIDRWGVGPEATRRERRLARLVQRHDWRADRAAAKDGHLVLLNGTILRRPALASTPAERGEQPELSPTARRLLDATKAAIAAGRLKDQPSAYAINKHSKTGGMPAAQQVRDYLRAESATKGVA